ncbi:hypothetical protein L1987_87365 [Smallanthus sonchifolius]|nr:hypothetical protein L1987_87365 [Smallanthus sonchifolius]
MHQIPSTYSSPINTHLQYPEHEHLNCPRCDSDNTKFCYYNNYNLSQPRHYCKNCRRYWTKGGTLRKVPIGGGTRKTTTKRSSNSNKRPADSSPATAPPPDQLKPEPSVVFNFGNDQSKSFNSMLKSNYRGRFGGFVDELTPNLTDGSEKDVLNGTAGFQVDYLSVNHDRNQSGESSGSDEWPNLSIFTSGSGFR